MSSGWSFYAILVLFLCGCKGLYRSLEHLGLGCAGALTGCAERCCLGLGYAEAYHIICLIQISLFYGCAGVVFSLHGILSALVTSGAGFYYCLLGARSLPTVTLTHSRPSSSYSVTLSTLRIPCAYLAIPQVVPRHP